MPLKGPKPENIEDAIGQHVPALAEVIVDRQDLGWA
jgi:hypothetical protein